MIEVALAISHGLAFMSGCASTIAILLILANGKLKAGERK